MSDPYKKSTNPFLKSSSNKGSIFGGQKPIASSQLFGGVSTSIPSTVPSLFGGAALAKPPDAAAKDATPATMAIFSSSSNLSNQSTFGSVMSGVAKPAFSNTHSLFASSPPSVFGGVSLPTAKTTNVFSASSKSVTNVHSLFGNAPSSISDNKTNPFTYIRPQSNETLSSSKSHPTSSFGLFSSKPASAAINYPPKDTSSSSNTNPFSHPARVTDHGAGPSDLSTQSKAQTLSQGEALFNTSYHSPRESPRSEQGSSDSRPLFKDATSHASTASDLDRIICGTFNSSSRDTLEKSKPDDKILTPTAHKMTVATGIKEDAPTCLYDDIFDIPLSPPTPVASSVEKKALEPTTIICTSIADGYLDKKILKTHFGKFGNVLRVSLHSKANQAQVNFDSHESASLAKRSGKKLHPNLPDMQIFFGTAIRTRSEDKQDNKARQSKSNAVKFLRQNSIDNLERTRRMSQGAGEDSSKLFKEKPKQDEKPLARSSLQKFMPSPRSSESTSRLPMDEATPAITATNFTALRQVRANTSQDKYALLEARDKLIRKQQTKILDVKKAKYLSATCPDMCPEKERYMREVQYDLSPYEMTCDRKVDHKRAVKKFSRSSADKHEPLPHELRPGSVLRLTMDYLMWNILPDMEDDSNCDMDLCYNYLWDRTRAMRSDIMQQHLLDESAVYVLERCVRFHIYCTERLCLEPPDVFDPKMNAEHLSKSMHSLKELYHDLSENSIYVDSEAEFRAYEILLDVDDGNIMFAYLHFRDSVRKSPEVQFAVEILHAVQSNNFVRFFRLVKKATFLQSCILHKYFNRIRSKALVILTKALNAPSKSQSISLAKLCHLLLFENTTEAAAFLAHHGLCINASGRVVLDRKSFIPRPMEAAPLSRAYLIVGGKKEGSLGEEINGGPLPPNPLLSHEPCSSFSAENFLLETAFRDEVKEHAVSRPVSNRTLDELSDNNEISEYVYKDVSSPRSHEIKNDADIPAHFGDDQDSQAPDSNDFYTNEEYFDSPDESDNRAENTFSQCHADDYSGLPDDGDEVYDEDEGYEAEDNDAGVPEAILVDDNYEEPSLDAFNSVHQNMFGEMADTKVVDDAVSSILGEAPDYSNEEKVRDFRTRKLRQQYFSRWQQVVSVSRKIRAMEERLLCRCVLRKWRLFVARRKLWKHLQQTVRHKLSSMRVKRCFVRWRRAAIIAKLTKKNTQRRRDALSYKYFNLWLKNSKKRKWHKMRLGDGFPAAPSRLSVTEQNDVWAFHCASLKCPYTRLHDIEQKWQQNQHKIALLQNLSAGICNAPLPVQSSFQQFIDSKNVPRSSKPKFFTLVVCFLDDVDEFVAIWFRKKFNPTGNYNPVPINCSYKIFSPTTHTHHIIQIVESKLSNISRISGVSSILYVVNSSKTEAPTSMARAQINSPNSKSFVVSRRDCSSPHTSLGLKHSLLELYKNSTPVRKLLRGRLPQIVSSFISKHVLEVAAETERYCAELCYAPLPAHCYHLLYHRALLFLQDTLLDERLRGLQWQVVCPDTQEHVIRMVDEPLRRTMSDALELCQLSAIPSHSWSTWSGALEGLLTYIKFEFSVGPSSPEAGLIEDIQFQINQAKQFVVEKYSVDDSDTLQSEVLLPWKNIYSSLIIHKVGKLPDVDVVCCSEEIDNYVCGNDWFLSHLVPMKTLLSQLSASKRKALNSEEESTVSKKAKPDLATVSLFQKELDLTVKLETHLKELIEDRDDVPLVTLFQTNDGEQQDNCSENEDADSDTSLLCSIAHEKQKYSALEERLRKMVG